MNGTNRSKAGLFLFEFTMIFLIFALSSTVALRLFAKSNEMQRAVETTDAAVAYAQSAVERLKACGGADTDLAAVLGSGTVYLDASFAPTDRANASYEAVAIFTKEDSAGGRYIEGSLSVLPHTVSGEAADPLFALPFGIFFPADEGGEAA